MSKETNGIANRRDCNEIVNNLFTSDLDKCPTKSEIINDIGIININEYTDNQLIKYSDLIEKETIYLGWFELPNIEVDNDGATLSGGQIEESGGSDLLDNIIITIEGDLMTLRPYDERRNFNITIPKGTYYTPINVRMNVLNSAIGNEVYGAFLQIINAVSENNMYRVDFDKTQFRIEP